MNNCIVLFWRAIEITAIYIACKICFAYYQKQTIEKVLKTFIDIKQHYCFGNCYSRKLIFPKHSVSDNSDILGSVFTG